MTALVDAAWLRANPATRVVDTRWYLADHDQGRREYADGHIPGAVFLDLEDDLSASDGPGRHPLPTKEAFAATLGGAGISNTDHVVVYDHGPGAIAARLWWMLRWVGHDRVSVLDGGIAAWIDLGGELTTEVPAPVATEFAIGAQLTRTIDREELLARLGAVTVIDARATERYTGAVETVDAAAGHIPTSLSAPTTGNLVHGRFADGATLAERFAGLGLDAAEPTITSCGSGVTACHNALALHLAGHAEPILYPGSWSDWSASGFPVATGPTPGQAPTTS